MLPTQKIEQSPQSPQSPQSQQQLFMQSTPKFSKSERYMRTTGIALILFAGLVFSGSIVLARKFHPLIGGTFLLGIPALAPGLFFVLRSYWDDPRYVKRIAEKNRHHSFEELVTKFTFEKVYLKMYDQATLSAKFEEHGKNTSLSYWQLHAYSKYDFYNTTAIRNIFLHRLEHFSLSYLLQQPSGENTVKALIHYNIITLDEFKAQFLAESHNMNLHQVLTAFTWTLFDLGIADPLTYRQSIIEEMNNFQGSLENFFQRYSEKVVTLGILPHTHPMLKVKFFDMMKRLPYSRIPASLLDEKYDLVPEHVRGRVNALLRKASEISCWNSPETQRAKERYYHPDNEPTISLTYNYTYDNSSGRFNDLVRHGTRENPFYFRRDLYEQEVRQDDTVRRPARIQAEVDAPWIAYFSSLSSQKLS